MMMYARSKHTYDQEELHFSDSDLIYQCRWRCRICFFAAKALWSLCTTAIGTGHGGNDVCHGECSIQTAKIAYPGSPESTDQVELSV